MAHPARRAPRGREDAQVREQRDACRRVTLHVRVDDPPERVWTRQLKDIHHALPVGATVEPTIEFDARAAGGPRQAAARVQEQK